MTMPTELDVVVAPAETEASGSYVDWPAIIAGIVIASAISVVLLSFGSALGLSFVDFRAGDDVNPIWIAIAAATWLLWVQVSSFMAGAYATGRLRKRHADATEDESDVRDGAHGLLVWAGALVVGALIAASGLASAVSSIGSAAATLTTAASNVADEAVDPTAYYADWLLRPAAPAGTAASEATPAPAPADATTAAPATGTTTGATSPASPAAPATVAPAAATAAPATADTSAARAEAGRILAQGAVAGSVSDADRTYLAQLVAANTGMTEDEATARVDEVMTAVEAAKAQAVEAAEAARKTTVLGAFLTAAAFLVSAVGAFWAAQKGGNHRDRNTVFPGVFRRL